MIKPVQDSRYDNDAWEDSIRGYVRGRTEITVADCAQGALNLPLDRLSRPEQMRITKVFKLLGLKKTHTRSGNVWGVGEHS